ncbi:hypothetical protein OUZ56_018371 [Daphnia magna]|uniref:Uncharacterized protein n=1 Tax=Daphnia magna TaxID=35525 RepID=A0ABQ9Z8M7_9CRUS|nr:hypothetical protein OUZ56_018371 [Daphnia magna]
MSEAVSKAESIESDGNISIEDEMKPEAVKNDAPLLPDNDLKQKRGRRKAAHTKLTNQLRKAVADHKMGAIRLKKLQVAAWRDELTRIYEDVKDLHHKYATSSRQSASSIGTTASDVTVSTTLSQKRSTRSASNVSLGQPSQRDLCIQKQMLELEVKMERARIQMEASTTSATETLSKALKGMVEQLSKLVDSAERTSSEIAANTNFVKDSRSYPKTLVHHALTCNPCPPPGDDTSSDTTPEPPPTAGPSNHPHRGCCSRPRTPNFTIQPFDGNPKNYARFKAKFRALYEHEYNGSPALLFMLEELLTKEVRNEIGDCLVDEAMYSVIPPLKNQDAASLKTFANRLHGAVMTLSQSRYAHELHSRTTLMAMEAKLTTYLKEKWNEKRKRTGAELNVLDLDDWVTVKSMSKQHASQEIDRYSHVNHWTRYDRGRFQSNCIITIIRGSYGKTTEDGGESSQED